MPTITHGQVTYAELLTHAHHLSIPVIPWDECRLRDQIGYGSAMRVLEGTCWTHGSAPRDVAFKRSNMFLNRKTKDFNRNSTLAIIRQEIRMMGWLKGHPHVVQLLGMS